MKLVLDTNILVSCLISKKGSPYLIYEEWNKKYALVTSQFQIDELRRVLNYPKLRSLIKPKEALELLASIDGKAEVVDVLVVPDISPDPDDNQIIATALAGSADYLVSGDKSHLLILEEVQEIKIVTANQMLLLLSKLNY